MYEELIDRPHHVSRKHRPMSRRDRAAQFAPFAALTGLDEAVDETARLTGARHELTEEELEALNGAMLHLTEHAAERPEVTVTYFCPDPRKPGGSYRTVNGCFRFLDLAEGFLRLTDRTAVPLEEIVGIQF